MRIENIVKETLGLDAGLALKESDGVGSFVGWDSLGHLNLMVAIESAFGVRWTTREIAELQTVGEIKRALAKRSRPLA